ncbi:EamA family transporter [Tolypothrix campylonemoides VB511288]|nr:EamA family transporter [Tolypothrix campylonemoides VB511288]
MLQNLQSFSFSNWLSIFYLASLGSIVAFLFYYEGLKAIGAAKTAIFITLVPVLTATFAAVLFKEPLPPTLVLGGVLVVVGVSLTNRS